MADAVLERRPASRFFCHRCNMEFDDVLQDYICPCCASGFIELIESDPGGSGTSEDVSEADMSTLDDTEEVHQFISHPMLNDLAFLMSGGRLRGSGRPESLLEQLVWTISGGAGTASITAGTPFVLVGAPGDYVFGGEGLDAVVTQLLGQLENSGPAPLPSDQIDDIASMTVTADQVATTATCSVCWENFTLGETVSRLECEHIFHPPCITPWLQLHATCPICRRSLLLDEPAAEPDQDNRAVAPQPPGSDNSSSRSVSSVPSVPSLPSAALLLGRMARLVPGLQQSWDSPAAAAPGSSAATASVTVDGVWAPRQPRAPQPPRARQPPAPESEYNMDIEFD